MRVLHSIESVYGGVGKSGHMQTLKRRQGGTCESWSPGGSRDLDTHWGGSMFRPSCSQGSPPSTLNLLEGLSPARRGGGSTCVDNDEGFTDVRLHVYRTYHSGRSRRKV